MNTPLQQAAQAVVDRWDSPLWKDQPHTSVYIAELRKALEAEQAQEVEPCKGHNCGSISPKLHSAECFDEHEALAGCQRPFGYFHFVFDSDNGDYWRETDDESEIPLFTHPAPPAEQAQAVEHVATVQCINGVTIGYLDVMQPVGTKLYTHPAPPAPPAQAVEPVAWMVYVAEANNQYAVCDLDDRQLVDDCTNHNAEVTPLFTHPAPPPAGERAELIADLRLNHEYCPKEVILEAADMLESDVSFINEGNKAQQVAALEKREPLNRVDILNIHALRCWPRTMFADKSYGIALDTVTVVDFVRAIEAHHGIGAKP
jgi:hypothetical protein